VCNKLNVFKMDGATKKIICSVVLNIPVLMGNYLNAFIVFGYTLTYVVSQFSGQYTWIVSFVPRHIEIKYS